MKITKFKKYISWNIISITGYFCLLVGAVFFVMLILSSSQLDMRSDLDLYFYQNILNRIINPYFGFYKYQLTWIFIWAIISFFENQYYIANVEFGLRIFENHDKQYSIIFLTGVALNFLPLYIMFLIIITNLVKFI